MSKTKINKPVKQELIYIEWEDASATANWKTMAEALKFSADGFIVKQTGWILQEDEKRLVLAGSINPQKQEEATLYGDIISIPKTWMRNRVTLTKYIPENND